MSTISKSTKICLILSAILLCGVTSALAENIKLRMRGSSLTLEGRLVEYNGTVYVVDVAGYGPLRFESDKFDCVSGSCPSVPSITTSSLSPRFGVYGSNTIGAKLMPSLIEAYAESLGGQVTKRVGAKPEEVEMAMLDAENKKVADIDLRSHGSGTSFPGLATNQAEIGMSSRPIKDKEVANLQQAGFPDLREAGREHVLALDGLLVIVSPRNKITGISMDQLAQVFSGQITDWSQLGMTPGPINIYARDDKSGTYDTFKSLVLKPAKVNISPNAKRFESNAELSDEVAADPFGIGFTGFAYKRNAKALSIATSCGINFEPTVFNVKTEEYPLARRLFLYTTGRFKTPEAKKLLEFSLSDDAQEAITEVGFIDQSEEYLPFAHQGDRIAYAVGVPAESFDPNLMKSLTALLQPAKRMSITLRFRPGSSDLDNKARRDVFRLATLLRSGQLGTKQIYLVGFADSGGAFDVNRIISRQRAETVKQEILSASGGQVDGNALQTVGFGELLPIGCNSNPRGRQANRRVEVWIR